MLVPRTVVVPSGFLVLICRAGNVHSVISCAPAKAMGSSFTPKYTASPNREPTGNCCNHLVMSSRISMSTCVSMSPTVGLAA